MRLRKSRMVSIESLKAVPRERLHYLERSHVLSILVMMPSVEGWSQD